MIATKTPPLAKVDSRELAAALRKKIWGEVRFDAGARALYATDGSNYRQAPIGVVIPKDRNDIIQTVAICRSFGVPIVSRGGGTSLAGQCCNVAVVMDMSKYYNKILNLDIEGRTARVQPGLVLDKLRAAAEKYELTFGPDPATHDHCTLGGMLGNDSCGTHAQWAGRTMHNTLELEILTYDGLELRVGPTSDVEFEQKIRAGGRVGQIYGDLRRLRDTYAAQIRERFPKIPRLVSGFALDQLLPENDFNVARALVGTESTCVTILEATMKLLPNPKQRTLLVLGYDNIYEAADHVPDILPFEPIALEGIDDLLIENLKKQHVHLDDITLMPPGKGWLAVEFGGDTKQITDAQAAAVVAAVKKSENPPSIKIFDDKREEEAIWSVREGGLGATAFVPGSPDTWEGWEDSAVPPERIGEYLRELRKLYDKYEYKGAFYGHFGQGCLHTRINFDLVTAEGLRKYRAFVHEAADIVVRYGGSLSGEHGDGQSRAELLPKMFGAELMNAFGEFKTIWDPNNRMNPGKVVYAAGMLDHLRLGTDYNPANPKTHFQFPNDKFTFARSVLRCVGVGKCRQDESGTMCPSYMVTREEKDSTRGRAHLLFEMLRGEVIKDGWRSEEVKDALDLCLACKGCKGDCPVSVDMATYKAEFLSHYYSGRLRPRSAYAFGLIHWSARLASVFPRLANFFTHAPLLSTIFKWAGGISPQRDVPRFAPKTFKDVFHARTPAAMKERPRVILWADTFNNHFHPNVALAAADVLDRLGYAVEVPRKPLCCGRPLYDYGMLDLAKTLLEDILEALRPDIRAGIPVIALEPSCGAVFKDELVNLFPHDQDALRLSRQTYLFAEFLTKYGLEKKIPTYPVRALVHGHCHQKALVKLKAEEKLLSAMGVAYEIPDSGCCGMAGGFGFEKDHYAVSMQVGERVLLPAVRQADPKTLVIADGFSCHEQIKQGVQRQSLHIAQLVQEALLSKEAVHE